MPRAFAADRTLPANRRATAQALVAGDPIARLLGELGDVTDEHILIVGHDGLELMCELLHRGAAATTLLCSHERPEPDSASLVVVLHMPSLDWLDAALPHLRRALTPTGRLVIDAGIDPDKRLACTIRRMLRINGYSALHANSTTGHLILGGQVPAFGLRHVA